MSAFFLSSDLLLALATIMTVGFVALLWWLNWAENPFHLHDLVIAPETGKASVAHVILLGAFICSSLVLIWETVHGRMSEWLMVGYLGVWGGVKVGELAMRTREPKGGAS